MSEQNNPTQDERVLAALAHGSILLGFFTGGVGGILAALVIWLVERSKSAYASAQALQALVYQAITFLITVMAWCCWGLVWMLILLVPLSSNPQAWEGSALPAGLWVGLGLMAIPLGFWILTIIYGLYGAARCAGRHDFRYALIGKWLKSQ
jgi:uncharacterized Tic20 family protein